MFKSLFLGIISFAFTSIEAQAFTAYEVAALVNKNMSENSFKDYEADLFPSEQGIENFPDPIEPAETNPEVLEEYYRNVAVAYRNWGEKKLEEAQKSDIEIRQQTQNLNLSKFRGKLTKSGSINQPTFEVTAQMHKARYARDNAHKCHVKASDSLQKADFYEAMAETCVEISNNL